MEQRYKKGLVSVGIPIYNGAKKIGPALESLLNQTYRDIEYIISDNASTDDTEQVCKRYAERDSRIRYIKQTHNLTQVPNIEFVMKEAQGEFFVLGADDDWWNPTFVGTLVSILNNNPAYSTAIGSVRRIYEDGEILDEVIYTGELNLTHKSFPQVFDMMNAKRPTHWFCGVYKTKLIQDLIKIPFPKCKAHDRVFMCELSLVTPIYSIPTILHHKTVYRQSPAERYIKEEIGALYRSTKAHSKYVGSVVSRLIRSRNIPLFRKVWIYPRHLTAFVWRNRVFLREWFPKAFNSVLQIKRWLRRVA